MRVLKALLVLAVVVSAVLAGRPAQASTADLVAHLDELASSFVGGVGLWIADPNAATPLYTRNPDETTFRYPGPRPRTKEAAIVMLADGTEASVRSLAEKNADTIRTMVDKIVSERLAEGQLDESDLTLRDVQRIKDAFCELLLGVYHERIPYPEDRIARLPQRDAAAR